ncbi:MAG TPA: hypothetical protein VLJ42_01480 [Solirubrobacteraceae bacterium]|nr:hypothetical protein [Solirubrobacteraceae bacterium]
MRPSLHLLTDRRARRQRGARHAPTRPALEQPATEQPSAPRHPLDLAAQRVRQAGGPLDQASYACQCGFLFAAPVSTTVACPNCGASQAW